MTREFYNEHDAEYFKDKKAIMLVTVSNVSQQTIHKGELVRIKEKLIWGNKPAGFKIINKQRYKILMVAPEELDLIEDIL